MLNINLCFSSLLLACLPGYSHTQTPSHMRWIEILMSAAAAAATINFICACYTLLRLLPPFSRSSSCFAFVSIGDDLTHTPCNCDVDLCSNLASIYTLGGRVFDVNAVGRNKWGGILDWRNFSLTFASFFTARKKW